MLHTAKPRRGYLIKSEIEVVVFEASSNGSSKSEESVIKKAGALVLGVTAEVEQKEVATGQ
jgi:hypothetical protein